MLKHLFWDAILKHSLTLASFLVVFTVSHHFWGAAAVFVELPNSFEVDTNRNLEQAEKLKTEQLMARNKCWDANDKSKPLPGRVLIKAEGEISIKGAKVTTEALEQVFTDKDHDLVILAFCE